jgi:hypothetical protein
MSGDQGAADADTEAVVSSLAKGAVTKEQRAAMSEKKKARAVSAAEDYKPLSDEHWAAIQALGVLPAVGRERLWNRITMESDTATVAYVAPGLAKLLAAPIMRKVAVVSAGQRGFERLKKGSRDTFEGLMLRFASESTQLVQPHIPDTLQARLADFRLLCATRGSPLLFAHLSADLRAAVEARPAGPLMISLHTDDLKALEDGTLKGGSLSPGRSPFLPLGRLCFACMRGRLNISAHIPTEMSDALMDLLPRPSDEDQTRIDAAIAEQVRRGHAGKAKAAAAAAAGGGGGNGDAAESTGADSGNGGGDDEAPVQPSPAKRPKVDA